MKYLKYKGISGYRFERELGMSRGYWSKAVNPSSDILEKICCIYPDISTEWLLRGRGSMTDEDHTKENDNYMATIKERIVEYLIHKDTNVTRAEQDLGWGKSSLLKSTNLTGERLSQFLTYFSDLSAEWLLTGQGEMLKENTPGGAVIPLAEPKTVEKVLQMSVFNLYDIDVSAGLSRLFAEDGERQKAYLGQISIPNMPRCDGAVKVIGDSMYPLLKSGDIIAYRQLHSLQSVQWGEIYILQTECEGDITVAVKCVKKSDRGEGWVSLVSYNKEHEPKDVRISDITAIARVILCIRQLSIM